MHVHSGSYSRLSERVSRYAAPHRIYYMHESNSVLQGRYQLKQILSQKAGHETWLGTDLQTHDRVVIKLLTCSDQAQWHDLRLFEREATVLQHLSHPRIPKHRDSFCIDDRLLWFGLVQEYIPGSSLKR